MKKFSGVIAAAVREGVSDIHITGAHPVVLLERVTRDVAEALRTQLELEGLAVEVRPAL